MTAQVGGTASYSSAADEKSSLRRLLRQRRAALSQAQRRRSARRASEHALRALRARGARCVALYLAYGSELSTAALIESLLAHGIRVFLPRLVRGDMRMIELQARTRLQRNHYGINEPSGLRHARPRQLDAILLPLTGFDAQGHRLGTGGGYYDRYLAKAKGPRPWRLGYAYALQECASLPTEPWDIRLHAICTEHGLRRFN